MLNQVEFEMLKKKEGVSAGMFENREKKKPYFGAVL